MSGTILVMYYVPEGEDNQTYPSTPNAFVYLSAHSAFTVGALKSVFPWKLVPAGTPHHLRFGIEAGSDRFWLDLPDHEPAPHCTPGSISIRLSAP